MLTLKSYKSFEALLRLQIYWVFKSKLHVRRIHAEINPFGLNFLLTPKQQRHNQRLQTSPAAHRTSQIVLSDERKQGIYCVFFPQLWPCWQLFVPLHCNYCQRAVGGADTFQTLTGEMSTKTTFHWQTPAIKGSLFFFSVSVRKMIYDSSRMRKKKTKNLLSLYQPRAFGLVLVVGRSVCEGARQVC